MCQKPDEPTAATADGSSPGPKIISEEQELQRAAKESIEKCSIGGQCCHLPQVMHRVALQTFSNRLSISILRHSVFCCARYCKVSVIPVSQHKSLRAPVSSYGTTPSMPIEVFNRTILSEEAAVFCLERLSDIVEKNQVRVDSLELCLDLVNRHVSTKTSSSCGRPCFRIWSRP